MGYSPDSIHFETEPDLDPELEKLCEHEPVLTLKGPPIHHQQLHHIHTLMSDWS